MLFIVAFGQYNPTSDYLNMPEKNIEIIKDNADFWSAYKDEVHGGFHNYVDFNGNITISKKKSFNGQSRLAYAFTRAFMVTGDKNYLDLANHALDFLYRYGWDQQHGGWYAVAKENGDLSYNGWPDNDFNTSKDIFQQHYALLGIAAYVEATRDTAAFKWLKNGLDSNENLWDNNPEHYGYYKKANLDWSSPTGKGFNATIDAITTHMLLTYFLTEEVKYLTRLENLATNIMEHMMGSRENSQINLGFAESYDSQWNIDFGSTSGYTGHALKTAWCLSRIYNLLPYEQYKEAAMILIKEMWNFGYDHVNGGPFKKYNWNTGSITEGKEHWCIEQAYTSGMFFYSLTGDQEEKDICLEMADESIQFHMTKMIDDVHGGTINQNSNNGENPSGSKGNYYKSGYHTSEFAYYGYLYGNLFYKNQPVTLYYQFEALDEDRNIVLTPVAATGQVKILNVTLDGEVFLEFNQNTRELILRAGVGGLFEVTFGTTATTNVLNPLSENYSNPNFRLLQNYPNPWSDHSFVSYELLKSNPVKIEVMDMTGRIIYSKQLDLQTMGSHTLKLDKGEIPNLNHGIYFYKITVGEFAETKRMIYNN